MALDQIMVDLETLGVKEGAAILSIGLVRFSLSPMEEEVISKQIDISMKSDDFGEIENGTLGWWMGQDPEAIKKAFLDGDRVSLFDALNTFETFLSSHFDGFWSKGPLFDELLLRGAWERTGMVGDFPVKYWKSRDVRTAQYMLLFRGLPEPAFEGLKHSSLADALHQVKIVRAAFTR